jgi:hypothetical protein
VRGVPEEEAGAVDLSENCKADVVHLNYYARLGRQCVVYSH